MNTTQYLSMDHISGNKNIMGSIEVPIDREYPHEEPVNFPHIAIDFSDVAGLQSEKRPKRGTQGTR
jgi:hypothetical protein